MVNFLLIKHNFSSTRLMHFQQDIVQQLIKEDSQKLDRQLINNFPFLCQIYTDYSFSPQMGHPLNGVSNNHNLNGINEEGPPAQEDDQNQLKVPDTLNNKNPIHLQILPEGNTNEQIAQQIIYDESQQSERNRPRPRRRRERLPKGHPSNNLLSTLKIPHLQYLQRKLGKQFVENFDLMRKLMKKDGISKKDYEDMYKIKEFELAFECLFAEKVLYRALLQCRSLQEVKKVFQKKLHVFHEAFLTKIFPKIN